MPPRQVPGLLGTPQAVYQGTQAVYQGTKAVYHGSHTVYQVCQGPQNDVQIDVELTTFRARKNALFLTFSRYLQTSWSFSLFREHFFVSWRGV